MATISRDVPWMMNAIIDKLEAGKVNGNVTIIQAPLPDNRSAAVWLIDSVKTRQNLIDVLDLPKKFETLHI